MTAERFFIVGAPKCGTTSLARWLADHPQIYFSPIKEPHFYCTDLKCRKVLDREAYDNLFAKAPSSAKMLGEASTWYLFSQEAIPNILRDYPDAKFIVMTRDPVEMAISLFFHNRNKLHEPLDDFDLAWDAQLTRRFDSAFQSKIKEPAFIQYGAACSLGTLVERLYAQVRTSHVLHVQLENVKQDAKFEYKRVLCFLGVDDDGRISFPKYNQAKMHRSKLMQRILQNSARFARSLGIRKSFGVKQLISKPIKNKEVTPELRKRLEEYFYLERLKLKSFAMEMKKGN